MDAETGTVNVVASELANNNLYIVPTPVLSAGDGSDADTVVYTDAGGDTFVAVSDGGNTPKYYAAAAAAPSGVGKYLTLKFTFKVYTFSHANDEDHDGIKDQGEGDWDWSDSYLLSAADDAIIAVHTGESYNYTIDMTGRGKIGATSAATMYAAKFNSTNAQVTSSSTPAATDTIAANKISQITGLSVSITALGTIADSATYYVGIDGSQYSVDVTAGDECYSEGEYGTGQGQTTGATTTATLNWA